MMHRTAYDVHPHATVAEARQCWADEAEARAEIAAENGWARVYETNERQRAEDDADIARAQALGLWL